MQIVLRVIGLLWVIVLIGGLEPLAHAQGSPGATMVASGMAGESFWVGAQSGRSAKHVSKSGSAEAVGIESTNGDGKKPNDSIAAELTGSKSVPWAIVVGLTLLTLLPA